MTNLIYLWCLVRPEKHFDWMFCFSRKTNGPLLQVEASSSNHPPLISYSKEWVLDKIISMISLIANLFFGCLGKLSFWCN